MLHTSSPGPYVSRPSTDEVGMSKNNALLSESIRITLSDLDPQQVARRVTGHFQPCFPVNRPVNRPVFPSKDQDEMRYTACCLDPL